MARTRASVGAKVSSGKSSKARCSVAPPSSSNTSSGGEKSSRSYSGGNPVCPRETPKWQKAITNFFIPKHNSNGEKEDVDVCTNDDIAAGSAGTSKSKPKRNIIESDDEESGPVNKELDKTIELEPLVGEDSHKIEEYYDKNNKGKGVGKKTKGKENIDGNVERRNSKRDLEVSDQLPETKRVKVN